MMNPNPKGIRVDYDGTRHIELFRSLSAHKAFLRVMNIPIAKTSYLVDILPVHLSGNQCVMFRRFADGNGIAYAILKKTKLKAFFDFWKQNNQKPPKSRERKMLYSKFAEFNRFNYEDRTWIKKEKAEHSDHR
ncbi:hypothetical protein L596_000825 [Steinernema carpocapsae]|uniref:Uncharacterized protein n=1 Tax=Steinernema carpocapsae TaxID=34508 RepID=A0A4U8UK09_STECR|nr:hypothetical protein L596_000825 [Steinernema carpocapsae]